MPKKKQVPVIDEVDFNEASETPEQRNLRLALQLAVEHVGAAKTYECSFGKRTVKVKVWESAN